MDEADYLAVIAVLEEQLRGVGAAELADVRHYVLRDTETGDARVPDGRTRLKLMLEALSRKLAVEDRTTYDAALARMNDTLRGEGPRSATVETVDGQLISLAEAPDLSRVREELDRLFVQILEPPPPTAERS